MWEEVQVSIFRSNVTFCIVSTYSRSESPESDINKSFGESSLTIKNEEKKLLIDSEALKISSDSSSFHSSYEADRAALNNQDTPPLRPQITIESKPKNSNAFNRIPISKLNNTSI